MDAPFPFGLHTATAVYASIYAITWAVHFVFLAYVLAGSCWLAIDFALARLQQRSIGMISERIKDWLPFMFGAAITAGVAPLLFVQLLYKIPFYTANLLLWHRWMAVLPAMMIGFYLLYVAKSDRFARYAPLAIGAAFVLFAFIGVSWTENHLLSSSPAEWPKLYASGSLTFMSRSVLLRFAAWFFASFPMMLGLAFIQLSAKGADRSEYRNGAVIGVAGVAIACGLASADVTTFHAGAQAYLLEPFLLPYTIAAGAGLALVLVAFVQIARGHVSRVTVFISAIGLTFVALGIAVLRESMRARALALHMRGDVHARMFEADGAVLFIVFAVINVVLIGVCIHIVRRSAVSTH